MIAPGIVQRAELLDKRLVLMFDSTLEQDFKLAQKHCLGSLAVFWFQGFVAQQAMQCTYAKSIHNRMLP